MKPGEPIAQSSPIPSNHTNGNGTLSGNQTDRGPHDADAENVEAFDRGRSRRKRDFFGTLRRRLGRSKSRAKSVERIAVPINAENLTGNFKNLLSVIKILSGNRANSNEFALVFTIIPKTYRRSASSVSCLVVTYRRAIGSD